MLRPLEGTRFGAEAPAGPGNGHYVSYVNTHPGTHSHRGTKTHAPWTHWPTDVRRPLSPAPTHTADPQRQGLRQLGGRLCLGPTARLLLSKANTATATTEHLRITSRGHLQASKESRTWCCQQSLCGKLSPGNSSDGPPQGPLTPRVRPALADALASEMYQNAIPQDIHLEEKGGPTGQETQDLLACQPPHHSGVGPAKSRDSLSQAQKRHWDGGAVLQEEWTADRYTGCPTQKNAWI